MDAIISNPPFSLKKDVLKRCEWLGIKWCFILPILFVNDGTPLDYGKQLMLFRLRVKFDYKGMGVKQPRTNCVVMSNGLLKRDYTVIMDKYGEVIYPDDK